MGGGRKSLLAMFGFKRKPSKMEELVEEAEARDPLTPTKIRSKEDDNECRYAEPDDIDTKAKEYIARVHKKMHMEKQNIS
ncbi:hypothetical protein Cni_G20546 [Canna indica]|uniref:Uncharacterized protein n=1 Tax=Canna indica TaxID=4628 RepID=A0AAQ3KQ55_9LILI|nr:hypothetical protein Cni_G20546 [Canna indica]